MGGGKVLSEGSGQDCTHQVEMRTNEERTLLWLMEIRRGKCPKTILIWMEKHEGWIALRKETAEIIGAS